MTSEQVQETPSGWYADPTNTERGRRYWDGSHWTDHFEFPTTPAQNGGRRTAQPLTVQQTVINVGRKKSVFGAVLLALFFGPLGMLYATVPGAIVMFFVNLIVGILTVGLGLLITIPLGALWAGIAASSQNNSSPGVSTQVVQPAAELAQRGD